MEIEDEEHLPLLDIEIYRKTDSSLGHKVYRKPTHTNLSLHQKSYHHPANKHSVLSSLVHRATALCDQESLAPELTILAQVFQQNGYSHQQIKRAMKPATRTIKTEDKPISTAYLPHTQTTYGRISRMLAKYNIKSIVIPPRKISSYMPPTKDAPGLRTPGIYKVPCECGKVYIGQRGRSVQLRIKEHGRHIRLALNRPEGAGSKASSLRQPDHPLCEAIFQPLVTSRRNWRAWKGVVGTALCV